MTTAGDEFTDDPDDPDDHAAAAILGNDHIDFLDHGDSRVEYEDDFRDDEDDDDDEEGRSIFRHADGDKEAAIGLNKQTTKR